MKPTALDMMDYEAQQSMLMRRAVRELSTVRFFTVDDEPIAEGEMSMKREDGLGGVVI